MDSNSSARQVVLISGASSGIGRALAVQYGGKGYATLLSGRNVKALEDTASMVDKAGGKPDIFAFDVGNRVETFKSVEKMLGKYGSIDVMVCNAGVGLYNPVVSTSEQDIERVFKTNFWGVVNMAQSVCPSMLGRKKGSVAIVSSTAGFRAWPGNGYYCASKHALNGFAESLRLEMLPYGVKVSLIMPDQTDTGLLRNSMNVTNNILRMDGQGMTPDYVASQIIKAVEKGKPRTIIGLKGVILRCLANYAPSLLDAYMKKIAQGQTNGQRD